MDSSQRHNKTRAKQKFTQEQTESYPGSIENGRIGVLGFSGVVESLERDENDASQSSAAVTNMGSSGFQIGTHSCI